MRVVNPYNFISFGNDINDTKKTREEVYRGENDLLSGWLDVELIPSTPLIIPDGAHPIYIDTKTEKVLRAPSEDQKKHSHKKYEFMNRLEEDDKKHYYVPGSSLRGMIRSVYEAATDSCVPFLLADKKKPISQRVPLYAALKNRGLLAYEYLPEKEGYVWRLYSAYVETEVVRVTEEKKDVYRNGMLEIGRNGKPKTESVFHFKRADKSEISQPAGSIVGDKGVLQYNVPVDINQDYHIAYLKKKDIVYTWEVGDDEAYRLLNSVLLRDNVKGNQNHRNSKPAKDVKKALDKAQDKKGNLVPVYYFKVIRKHETCDEVLVYLSNSSAGRIAQKRKWADIMESHGPCKGEKLCPACLLFGSLDKNYGLKTHIRITDAIPEKGALDEKDFAWKRLDILGEPRTSAFEFYLERPEGASYWNFDFYGMNVTDKNGVSHTRYYDLAEAMPRGRKMYWHGKEHESSALSDLNATMQATKETFKFKVYFDEITKEQLDSLIWVLTLGDNDKDSRYQHKLGHAKPLGYGSVKLIVTGENIRSFATNSNGCYTSIKPIPVPKNPVGGIDLNKQYVQEILHMSDKNAAADKNVGYPAGADGKIYTWFSENRVRAETVETLPKPADEDISLPDLKKSMRHSTDNKTLLTEGMIFDVTVVRIAETNDGYPFGVFVKLPGNIRGLLHRKQMKKQINDYSEGQKIRAKLIEIRKDKNGKKYNVTDKI